MTHLTDAPIDLAALLATGNPADGAVLLFAGTVREHNAGRAVCGMHYSAQRALAEQRLAAVCREAEERFAIRRCHIVHRLGALSLGEISVAVLVQSAHRDAAYRASRFAIDTLKERAPIWKQERYVDGDSAYLDGQALDEAL